jgi:hypothetical protein
MQAGIDWWLAPVQQTWLRAEVGRQGDCNHNITMAFCTNDLPARPSENGNKVIITYFYPLYHLLCKQSQVDSSMHT